MWTVVSGFFSFLNGGSVKSIADSIANISRVKADTVARKYESDNETERARIEAARDGEIKGYDFQIKALETMGMLLIAEQSWWVTRLIRPSFAYMFFVHILGMLFLGWEPPKDPALAYLEYGVVGSYFALRPFEKNARAAAIEKLKAR